MSMLSIQFHLAFTTLHVEMTRSVQYSTLITNHLQLVSVSIDNKLATVTVPNLRLNILTYLRGYNREFEYVISSVTII